MSSKSKQEYFEAIHKRYREASRKEKTIIIDECCAICGYHREHAIRRLRVYKRFTNQRRRKGENRLFIIKKPSFDLSSKYG